MIRSAALALTAAFALTVPANAADPAFVLAAVDSEGVMAVDMGNLQTRGDIRKVDGWLALPDSGADGYSLVSFTAEFDCDLRRRRLLISQAYDMKDRPASTDEGGAWTPIREGTNAVDVIAVVCGETKGRPVDLTGSRIEIRRTLLGAIGEQDA